MPSNPGSRQPDLFHPVGASQRPSLAEPGVTDRERESPINDRSIHVPPESPLRADKGDLGEEVFGPAPRPLTHSGSPFKNLRKR